MIAYAGFDFAVLDQEHGPSAHEAIEHQVRAAEAAGMPVLVRVQANRPELVLQALDAGAIGVMAPHVRNADDAEALVRAAHYPPAGIRGITTGGRASRYGRATSYLKEADQQVCLLVQAETMGAIDQIPEIAAVDGVDGIFVGPSDLSASMGHIGNPLHPEVQRAIEFAAKRINDAGKMAGILTAVEADAQRYIQWGYRFVAVGTDIGLLARNADALAAAFRKT